MRVIASILLLLLLMPVAGIGQTPRTTSSVDAETYRLWQAGDWNTLIHTGREAMRQGIDFYYLRYRMGIAWYEKGNYHQAAYHFRKAREYDPNNVLLKEYLYYSLLFSGRYHEAARLEDTLTLQTKRMLNIPENRVWHRAYLSYSYNPGAPSSAIGRINTQTTAEGFQSISKRYHLVNAGIEHRVGSRFWLHHSYTHIQRKFHYHQNEGGQLFQNPDDKSYVNQYYLGATGLVADGLDVRFGFHFIHLLDYQNRIVFLRGMERLTSVAVTDQDFAGFASIYRSARLLTTNVTLYAGNLNNAFQYQQDVGVTLYPFGNLNLYSRSVLSHQYEKMTGSEWRSLFVLQQSLGLKLAERFWVEGNAGFGEIRNFFAADGAIVYNDIDVIKAKYGAALHFMLSAHIHARLDYVLSDKESSFRPLQADMQVPDPIDYQTSSLTVTILWRM
jgi:hypothetical protein